MDVGSLYHPIPICLNKNQVYKAKEILMSAFIKKKQKQTQNLEFKFTAKIYILFHSLFYSALDQL